MRSDMTVPIARLVANRYADAEPPFRLCYLAHAYREVRPQRGQMREFTQAGVELRRRAGAARAPPRWSRSSRAALDAAGLTRAVIGLGDADLYRPAARRARGRRRAACADPRLPRHARPRRARGRGRRGSTSIRRERETLTAAADAARRRRRCSSRRAGSAVPAVERASRRLTATFDGAARRGVAERVQLDLGLLRDLGYYTGAILEVYDPALGHILGGGGRYDELMGRFGRPLPAAGFALYLERLHVAQAEEERLGRGGGSSVSPIARALRTDEGRLRLALPRGALFDGDPRPARRGSGSTPPTLRGDSRSLVFETGELRLVTMRPSDVPTYVEAGAAHLGITGKDVLAEQSDRAVYELLDLGYGACRMVLAARRGDDSAGARPSAGSARCGSRPSTRARPSATSSRRGRQAEVIEVKGSVELAPLVGLADGIVDLVDTGRTLAENELEVREEISACTARLVANRVAHKLRAAEIDALADRLREATAMKLERIEWDSADVPELADRVRELAPRLEDRRVRGRRDRLPGRAPGRRGPA